MCDWINLTTEQRTRALTRKLQVHGYPGKRTVCTLKLPDEGHSSYINKEVGEKLIIDLPVYQRPELCPICTTTKGFSVAKSALNREYNRLFKKKRKADMTPQETAYRRYLRDLMLEAERFIENKNHPRCESCGILIGQGHEQIYFVRINNKLYCPKCPKNPDDYNIHRQRWDSPPRY